VRAVREYIDRHSRANVCDACGQPLCPAERRSDRAIVMTPA
jgi:hypothetical protein